MNCNACGLPRATADGCGRCYVQGKADGRNQLKAALSTALKDMDGLVSPVRIAELIENGDIP